jgi:hypothetical protein
MKKVNIIPIARGKADRRGIKAEWIEDALAKPDQVVSGYGGEKLHRREYGSKERNTY